MENWYTLAQMAKYRTEELQREAWLHSLLAEARQVVTQVAAKVAPAREAKACVQGAACCSAA